MATQTSNQDPPDYTPPTVSSSLGDMLTYNEASEKNPAVLGMQAELPVIMDDQVHSPTINTNYRSRQSMILGIMQIIVGVLCIVFNSVAIASGAMYSRAGIGIWGGIMVIVCGSFGIAAAKVGNKYRLVGFLVLCLSSTATTVALFVFSVISAAVNGNYLCDYDDDDYDDDCYVYYKASQGMNGVLSILAVVGAATSIWGSVISFKAVCYFTSPQQQHQQQAESSPVQYVTMQGGQPMIIVPQYRLNYGGQVNYAQEYPGQEILTVPAPSYQVSYSRNTAPRVVQPSNNNQSEVLNMQPPTEQY